MLLALLPRLRVSNQIPRQAPASTPSDLAQDRASSPGARALLVLALLALGAGIVSRFVFLDADPFHHAWAGYLTDEGRWTYQARELALFGSLDLSPRLSLAHLVGAPLYQAATWLSFVLFGVGFEAARLVSALSGSMLLVAVFLFARGRFTTESVLLTMVALAFQPDLFFLSRIAIPEMASLLFELLAFAALVTAPRSTARAFVAGLLSAVAFGFKGTGLTLLPVFVLVILLVPRSDDAAGRAPRVAAYLGAVVMSAAGVLVAAVLLTDVPVLEQLRETQSFLEVLRFGFGDAYAAGSILLYETAYITLRPYVMCAWLLGGLVIATGRHSPSPVTAVYLGSAAWAAALVVMAAVMGYFPERYTYHAFVPLALNMGAGLTLLQQAGLGNLVESVQRAGRARRWTAAAVVALPTAVVLCPVIITGAAHADITIDRLTHHVVLMALLDLVLASWLVRRRMDGRVLFGLVVVPLLVVPVRVAAMGLGAMTPAYWTPGTTAWLGGWLLLIALATGTAALLWTLRRHPAFPRRSLLGFVLAFAGTGTVFMAPTLADRTYTIRDTAEDLQRSLGGGGIVWSDRATGIFLGNTLRIREVYEDTSPEVIVGMFRPNPRLVRGRYEVVQRYRIRLGVSQEYMNRVRIDPFARVFRRLP